MTFYVKYWKNFFSKLFMLEQISMIQYFVPTTGYQTIYQCLRLRNATENAFYAGQSSLFYQK